MPLHAAFRTLPVVAACALLSSCAGLAPGEPPRLGAAQPGTLQHCEDLAARAALPGLAYTKVSAEPAGQVTVGALRVAVPAHCLVQGKVDERKSPVDGATYAIGFEMRLPVQWNGRFFYQANGGLDGAVVPAVGGIGGGAPVTSALAMGFAVVSSDAGHTGAQNPRFGLDPQARIDYGYNAVARLTPLGKQLIERAYGRGPDRAYIGGCSNGGRHAMVAAARLPQAYDGVLAGDPGFNLPKAAIGEMHGIQQMAKVATAKTEAGLPDVQSAFTPAELQGVARQVLARCDALDGLADGIVNDVKACQSRFKLADVPTCAAGNTARDGSCLSAPQKDALASLFAGPRNRAGEAIYSTFPFDAGISGANWRQWKFVNAQTLDPAASAFVFSTPPLNDRPGGLAYALAFDMDRDAPRIFATSGAYAESSISFMTPPNATRLDTLRDRGAKMIVYHGTSDPVFSSDDTQAWYEGLQKANGGKADAFARYFTVPGMNHCSGGPATDQFDMLSALVDWVEQGRAPAQVVATSRGPGSAVPNTEAPAGWAPNRTRPLCPYPAVAVYQGGDPERAGSFACKASSAP